MISDHPSFSWPSPEQQLWRYVDLSKFISLLQTKTFWMSRADLLGDPFEGSVTAAMQDALRHQLPENPEVHTHISEFNKANVSRFFVSCWHASEHESAAMWRLYSQSDDAICLQTTFGRLSEALPSTLYAGMIRYIDYGREWFDMGNFFNHIIHKRRSFEHERECRFVVWDWERPKQPSTFTAERRDGGLAIPLDPNAYVDAVYLAPSSAGWFSDVVKSLATDYDLKAEVHQSALNGSPIY